MRDKRLKPWVNRFTLFPYFLFLAFWCLISPRFPKKLLISWAIVSETEIKEKLDKLNK